jgi:hypothetical protein
MVISAISEQAKTVILRGKVEREQGDMRAKDFIRRESNAPVNQVSAIWKGDHAAQGRQPRRGYALSAY